MSKSHAFCCVYGCNSKAKRDPVSFHYFPKYNSCKVEITGENGIVEKVDVRKIWEKNLSFGKKITDTMRVCSKHFEESAFHIQRDLSSRPRMTNLRRRKLKKNAVPTKKLPTRIYEISKKKARRNSNRCDPEQQPMLKSDCDQMTEVQDENELHAHEMIHTSGMSKSHVFCCVYGCNSKASRDPVSFHYFPKYNSCKVEITDENGIVEKVDVRKIWEKNLRCGQKITDTMRVCSKHFEESAFHIQRDSSSRPRMTNLRRRNLKRNAVPTINLPTHENSKGNERRNLNRCDPEQQPMEMIHTSDVVLAAEALCVIKQK